MSRIAAAAAMIAGTAITVDLGTLRGRYEADFKKQHDTCSEMTARLLAEARDFTADEQRAYDEALGKGEAAKSAMARLDRMAKLSQGETDEATQRSLSRKKPGETASAEADDKPEQRARYSRAYNTYLRYGMNAVNNEDRALLQAQQTMLGDAPEVRALSAMTGGSGGFTISAEMNQPLEKALLAFSGVAQSRSQLIPTGTGADLPFPSVDDTSNEGEMIGENTDTGTNQYPTFKSVNLRAFTFSSKIVLVPNILLQDSAVNIEQLLGELLGERLGRASNRKLTVGTGVDQPQGIVNFASAGKTFAGSAAITYAEMVELQHSVDSAYRPTAEWMFNDTTFRILRSIVDSDGRPIWLPGASASMQDGPPATLLGSRFVINTAMSNPATTVKSVLWGEMSKYKRRQVGGVTVMRLNERYAENFQTAFVAFLRLDGRGVNAGTGPIKYGIHT